MIVNVGQITLIVHACDANNQVRGFNSPIGVTCCFLFAASITAALTPTMRAVMFQNERRVVSELSSGFSADQFQ